MASQLFGRKPLARSRQLRQRLFAWMLFHVAPQHDRALADQKRSLLNGLSGTVIEIGPGTGVNFSYYPSDVEWIGVEPNIFMHPYLLHEARRTGLKATIHAKSADQLDFATSSADVVVCTLVLCSVRNPKTVLQEIYRVLRPGGRLIFIEHVAGPPGTWLRRGQRMLRPVWKILADGCHPDRETLKTISDVGFSRLRAQEILLPIPWFGPHVFGTAWKE